MRILTHSDVWIICSTTAVIESINASSSSMLSLVSLILPSFCALRSGGQLRLFQRTSICHPEDEAAGHSVLDWLHERKESKWQWSALQFRRASAAGQSTVYWECEGAIDTENMQIIVLTHARMDTFAAHFTCHELCRQCLPRSFLTDVCSCAWPWRSALADHLNNDALISTDTHCHTHWCAQLRNIVE